MLSFGREIRRIVLTVGLATALCGLFPRCSAADGDMNALRSDVRKPPEPSSGSGSSNGGSSHPYNPNQESLEKVEEGFAGLMFGAACVAVTSPIWVPMSIADDSLQNMWCFQRYPYEQTQGYVFNLDAAEAYHTLLDDPKFERKDLIADHSDIYPGRLMPKRISLRAAAEYGDNFNNIHYTGGSLLLNTTLRLGLDANWRYLEEHHDGNRFDALNLGKMDVIFQCAQSERMLMRFGLGSNWLADSQDTNFGFNFNYAIDLFPRKPWVISTEFDLGTLGNTHLFHARATAGVLFRQTEVFAGVDYLDIGRVDVGSFIGGVRFWF